MYIYMCVCVLYVYEYIILYDIHPSPAHFPEASQSLVGSARSLGLAHSGSAAANGTGWFGSAAWDSPGSLGSLGWHGSRGSVVQRPQPGPRQEAPGHQEMLVLSWSSVRRARSHAQKRWSSHTHTHTYIYIISNDSGMNVHQSRVCDKIAFLFFIGKSDDMRPPISSSTHFHITIPVMNGHDTVDERNPAPVNGWFIPLFLGSQPSFWRRISQPSIVSPGLFLCFLFRFHHAFQVMKNSSGRSLVWAIYSQWLPQWIPCKHVTMWF